MYGVHTDFKHPTVTEECLSYILSFQSKINEGKIQEKNIRTEGYHISNHMLI